MTLVLFDIDGTLISSGRAGVRGMSRSFERLFGVRGALDAVSLAGRTDRAIVIEALTRAGQPADDESVRRLRDAYFEDLPLALADPQAHPGAVLPGVFPLLDALASRSDAIIGLLTGNFASGARIKLGHFGLWERFAFGAFGDDHTDRRALVAIAVEAAASTGHPRVAPDEIVVIGDTPLDVDCAQAYGARAVAVATGPYSQDELAATGPAHTVSTLEELTVDTLLPGRARSAISS